VATCAAYYDASGSESGDGALVAIGVAATEEDWLLFEAEWQAVLDGYAVPYFHRKDLISATGPYEGWAGDTDRIQAFMRDLVHVAKGRIRRVAGWGVSLDDYRAIDLQYPLTEVFGGPYGYCTGVTIAGIKTWMDEEHPGERISHVVEKGDVGQKEFARMIEKEKFAPTLRPKKDAVSGEWFKPFQVADLMAGQWRRRITKVMAREGVHFDPTLELLRTLLLPDGTVANAETLLKIAKGRPKTFPPRWP
jgi:hypothetical protein